MRSSQASHENPYLVVFHAHTVTVTSLRAMLAMPRAAVRGTCARHATQTGRRTSLAHQISPNAVITTQAQADALK